MNIQKSFQSDSKATLYVVPTPIGNLEDITFRALKTLKKVEIIAAEDTRRTSQLLNHFEIQTSLISYHDHNKHQRIEQLIGFLKAGKNLALVSDAGMPAISDPGYELIQATIEHHFPVVVLPGANAALCALIGSGLPTNHFLFYGFLPRKRKEKERALQELKEVKETILLYESPYRIRDTLQQIFENIGDRNITLARELTKKFEEYLRGKVTDMIEYFSEHEARGEFCIVIEGNKGSKRTKDQPLWWSHLSIKEHVLTYVERESLSNKDAIQKVATDRNLSRRVVYESFHKG